MPECSSNGCKKKSASRLVKCKVCCQEFCKDCSKLSETEMRCIALRQPRLLIEYLCENCNPTQNLDEIVELEKVDCTEDITDNIEKTREEAVRENISYVPLSIFLDEIKKLTDKITDLHTEVNNLKQSNIDLVRTLTSVEYKKRHEPEKSSKLNEQMKVTENKIVPSANVVFKKPITTTVPTLTRKTIDIKSKNIKENHLREQESGKDLTENFNNTVSQKNKEMDEDGFTTVNNRRSKYRNRKSTAIIGTGRRQLATVPIKIWYFVSRIDLSITADILLKYFKEYKQADYVVKWMEPRGSLHTYNSFKVGIPVTLENECKNTDFWPPGSLVNKFLYSRRITTEGDLLGVGSNSST